MTKDLWYLNDSEKNVVSKIKSLPEALVITLNNFKGGVGKSTLIDLFAYIMKKYEMKVLLIDSDPQRNLTTKMLKNFPIKKKATKTFMEGIREGNLSECITQLDEFIYIVEGDWELAKLDDYSRKELTIDNQYYLYSFLIKELKSDFDVIMFDSVPTTSLFTHNCVVASDFVIAPTQAEEDSYKNTISYFSYLNSMQEYNEELDILGVVPYLTKDDNATNRDYLKKYYETFEGLTFDNIIKYSGRVLSWGTHGITENKGYDKQTLNMYLNVFKEFLVRVNGKLV